VLGVEGERRAVGGGRFLEAAALAQEVAEQHVPLEDLGIHALRTIAIASS
jgi:hypothetical protein